MREPLAALDAEAWTGPPAPEGSPERIEARRRLWDLARRAARVREQPAAEWLAGVRREAPQLVGAVGERDLAALVAYVWGSERWTRAEAREVE